MVSFKARRSEPRLVSPARPTPREANALSDIDDQHLLRYYETVVGFFRTCPGRTGSRPADLKGTIRAALAEALVYYYPVAGRLREEAGGKLVVDCTAEGVVFVEAEADVWLEEFGEPLLPPYPCLEELLCDPGDIKAVIGRPLLFMQVTELKCGGFVAGFHMCHNIADGFGMIQFMMTVAELTVGEAFPSLLPVWKRELLSTAHSPSPTTYPNPAYQPLLNSLDFTSDGLMLHLPGYLADSRTSFELLTAVMWGCRTIALGYESSQRVRLMITMNARGRWNRHTLIPWGYYGNAHFSPIAELTVDELSRQPLADTVELVRKTKLSVTMECMRSMVDTTAYIRQWPSLTMDKTYEVSDTRWIAAGNGLQLGWAEYVAGGITLAGDLTSKLGSHHMRCKNEDGENSTVVSLLLPRPAMERFKKEMDVWLKKPEKNLVIPSSL
ncbi:hypothetical protein PAHAL_9G354000 [Panicum hallii]|uniref:Uncharacterized protein n=1 Tax=Panicum hallii TaxID=206008 RepID=A0A2T8I3N3_9POAL|nr:hypothetical protein PAHAL_9G354000 [Panicum hallii]